MRSSTPTWNPPLFQIARQSRPQTRSTIGDDVLAGRGNGSLRITGALSRGLLGRGDAAAVCIFRARVFVHLEVALFLSWGKMHRFASSETRFVALHSKIPPRCMPRCCKSLLLSADNYMPTLLVRGPVISCRASCINVPRLVAHCKDIIISGAKNTGLTNIQLHFEPLLDRDLKHSNKILPQDL